MYYVTLYIYLGKKRSSEEYQGCKHSLKKKHKIY